MPPGGITDGRHLRVRRRIIVDDDPAPGLTDDAPVADYDCAIWLVTVFGRNSPHLKRAFEYMAKHDDVWLTTGDEMNDWYRKEYMKKGKK